MPSIFVTLLNVDPNADANPLGNYLNIIDLYHTYVPFSNYNEDKTRKFIIYQKYRLQIIYIN